MRICTFAAVAAFLVASASSVDAFLPASPSTTTSSLLHALRSPNDASWQQLANKLSSSTEFGGATATASGSSPTEKLQSALDSLQETLLQLATQTTQTYNPDDISPSIVAQIAAKLSDAVGSITTLLPAAALSLDTPETVLVTAVLSYIALSTLLSTFGQPPPPSQPYPLQTYDPLSAQLFFDQRPLMVLGRTLFIARKSLAFAVSLLMDKANNNQWETNMERRGLELAELLTQLGPTFIKIGQSLSIRTDLLPPAYVRGLSSLQDRVPAFDSTTAYQILQDEWGVSNIYDVLSNISPQPVAAASLGQVYKATLLKADDQDGTTTEIAIKVQRPNISTQIALDMHLLREAAKPAKAWFNVNTDTVGTVDAWGAGFVDELDYLAEGDNARYFSEAILETPLKDVVFAPTVVDELSTTKVLVTEWIDGERLDKSAKEDVTILCSIAMNTYLTMLLEMGILHCDPHPGNLLRTPDGKLCILDWGMVTAIPEQLQLTLIEHMAHLTSRDYAEVPRDLYLLGFVPKDKEKEIESSGVVEILSDIYGKWTDGGGMASINANEVLTNMQDLAAEKGNLFQIPPYFAYIAKSFSVLEGIGLSNDPKYSIINECLPYVSNRLLTDPDTMGNALNGFIFGADKNNIPERLVDAKRIEQLVSGFGSFSKSAASGSLLSATDADGAPLSRTEMLDNVSDQVLDIVLTEEETPLQKILLEQLVKISTANARMFWTDARLQSGVLPNGRTLLGTLVDPLGVFQTSPLVNANEQDEKTVEMTRRLIQIFGTMQVQEHEQQENAMDLQSLDREELIAFSRILSRKLWDRRDKVVKSTNRFLRQLLDLTAIRLETSDRVPLPERQPTLGIASASKSASTTPEHDLDDATNVPRRFPEPSSAGGLTPAAASRRLQSARDRLDSLTEQEL